MTWFRVDDKCPTNSKVRDAGLLGRGLFFAAGPLCAGEDTDGLVSPRHAKDAAYFAEVDQARATGLLVATGLWHDVSTISDCAPCAARVVELTGAPLDEGWHFFHNWWSYQLSRAGKGDPVVREQEQRRKRLYRDATLRKRIADRDRQLCRYCGVLTTWRGDRRSRRAGTYDHVDPFGENDFDNVVTACKSCNSKKKDRTPEQAGMPLLPPPTYLLPTNSGVGREEIRSVGNSADLPHGTGRVGAGLGVGSDQPGSRSA